MKRIFWLIPLLVVLTGCVGTSKMVMVVRGTQEPVEFEVQYEVKQCF